MTKYYILWCDKCKKHMKQEVTEEDKTQIIKCLDCEDEYECVKPYSKLSVPKFLWDAYERGKSKGTRKTS